MNLLMAPMDSDLRIIKIRKNKLDEKQEKFLANLGFIEDSVLSIVSETKGNLIINIKESRIAMGKELCENILVEVKGG